jgi:hypothetical protein
VTPPIPPYFATVVVTTAGSSEIDASARQSAMAEIQLVLILVTAIAFACWFGRGSRRFGGRPVAAPAASSWLSWIAARIAFSGDTIDELRNATALYLVGDAVDIVAAALAMAVVVTLTARQRARANPAWSERSPSL